MDKIEIYMKIKNADNVLEWIEDEGIKKNLTKEDIHNLVVLLSNESGMLPDIYIPFVSFIFQEINKNNIDIESFLFENQLYARALINALLYASSFNIETLRESIKEFVKKDMIFQEFENKKIKKNIELVDKDSNDVYIISAKEFLKKVEEKIKNNKLNKLMIAKNEIGLEVDGKKYFAKNVIKDVIKL